MKNSCFIVQLQAKWMVRTMRSIVATLIFFGAKPDIQEMKLEDRSRIDKENHLHYVNFVYNF